MDEEERAWYLRQAQVRWESYECAVSDQARIAALEEGAWVEAWVWIPSPKYFDMDDIIEVTYDPEEGEDEEGSLS